MRIISLYNKAMLVSVIIPTHKRPQFTQEAIESVKAQTFQDLEIIVIDDQEGKGPAWARNQGALKAKGEYIAFLDSDDLWEKKKLEKQLKYLQEHPEFSICYTNERWIRNGQHLNQMKKHQKYHGWIFSNCLPLCIISASSIIMKKEVFAELGGFDESLLVCEDYDLWLRMALKYPIAFLDEKLIVKRGGHSDQLSHKYWGMDRLRIKALEKLLKLDLDEEKRQQVLAERERKYQILLTGYWKRRKYLHWLYYRLKS